MSNRRPTVALRRSRTGTRRGSALILVLLMTLAVAGLSIAAIFMSSSAGLLSRFYDREREFRLAAESGIQVARSLLSRDATLAVPDTGVMLVVDSMRILDADGAEIAGVWVDVYAAVTGDTSGLELPRTTLVAASRDANGTRHVRRVDLRRESFSRYSLFTDSFPSGETFGPANVTGRVHTNGDWRATGFGNSYRDTVTAVGAITGAGTFDVDSVVGVSAVPYPADSTFAWMHTMATAANLDVTPVSGSGLGSRVEFVTVDIDDDDALEAHEGFVRVFDLAAGMDTSRLRASPPTRTNPWPSFDYYRWDEPIIQNQCGAFYHTDGRWHFFPIAAHRLPYASDVLTAPGPDRYPQVNNGMMNRIEDRDFDATSEILALETARCFPAGSPYLMPTERFTDLVGVVTGTAADTVPFGRVPPPGGWPATAPFGYGGSDTTFTPRLYTCEFTASTAGECATGTHRSLGTWRAFGGTAVSGVPSTVRQAAELPYLWPYSGALNPASRHVISASAGPLYVSGDVRGPVSLRVDGRAVLVDRLRYASDPNDPAREPCADRLGLVATGDVLVVDGLTAGVSLVATTFLGFVVGAEDILGGGEARFGIEGSLMSLRGTVGPEHPDREMGSAGAQLECPDDAGSSTRSNGGCLALTGGAVMRRFTRLHEGAYGGFRYYGATDRCQDTDQRPPFFPLTNRYTLVRTLEIEPSLARSAEMIRDILMRLKGQ